MKKALLGVAAAAMLVVAVGLLLSHVWVRNKTARMIYDGHVSDQVKLYVGTRGRLLVVMAPAEGPADSGTYLFHLGMSEVRKCAPGQFKELKSTALTWHGHPNCEVVAGARLEGLSPNVSSNQSLHFVTGSGKSVEVIFDPAPRER